MVNFGATDQLLLNPPAWVRCLHLESCSQAVLNIGNPLIWWSFIIVAVFSCSSCCKAQRIGVSVLCWRSRGGHLPWFTYPERTMFFFYALLEPYLILMLAGCWG